MGTTVRGHTHGTANRCREIGTGDFAFSESSPAHVSLRFGTCVEPQRGGTGVCTRAETVLRTFSKQPQLPEPRPSINLPVFLSFPPAPPLVPGPSPPYAPTHSLPPPAPPPAQPVSVQHTQIEAMGTALSSLTEEQLTAKVRGAGWVESRKI